jgi:hypothetical protein
MVTSQKNFFFALVNLIHNRILEEMFTTQKYDTTATLLLQKIFPSSVPKKTPLPPKRSELGQAAGMSH